MKHITLLLFLLTLFSFSTTKKETPSTIKDVTVYLNGAQVKRTSTIKLPVGTTEFVFNRLSPNIQESSIQVSGLKMASILSINYGINYSTKQNVSAEVETIQIQISELKDTLQVKRHTILGYDEELHLITQNRALGNTSEVVNLEKLQKFASYYRTRTTEIKSLIYNAEKDINELNTQILYLQKQLVELNVDERVQTGEIKIKLNNDTVTELNLAITYNVSDAGWFPIYDIKAEKIDAPIQLAYKAHVYQNTGSDWENVNLTLSTSDPNTNNVKPEMNPKYLNFISQYSTYKSNRATKNYSYKFNPLVKTVSGIITSAIDGLPLPGVNVIEKGTSNGTQTDFDGNYTLKTNGGKELVYSFLSMKTESLPIHSSIMNVSMENDLESLQEVTIAANKNFAQTLIGQVAGLNMSSADGSSGGDRTINLRGTSFLSGNNEPLFVIDGIPVDENDFRALNPNDIESLSVVKDAEATAIYGNKGAHGVVLVTTKAMTSHGDYIEEGITNTRFDIKKQYSIPSDGDVTVIEIDTYSVPATYSYFAAPVLNENVFLTAEIKDWEQYNLLPAEANVYFEGGYSGKTNINPQSTTEKLTISLGVDPNVIVKRTQPKDYKKNAFIGSNKIISKHYEIELKNNKSSAIDLVVYDRIPISQNKDIKIDDIETGASEYDDKKGILKWRVNLSRNDKSVYKFSYKIKYPNHKRVNL